MKVALTLIAAALAVSAAQPHHHGHQHLHEKRDPSPVADVQTVPGPTEVVYVLNGKPISEAEVEQGIKNGTLVWADNGGLSFSSSAPVAQPTSTKAPPPPSPAPTTTSSTHVAAPPSSAPAVNNNAVKASSSGSSSGGSGVDTPFPDGQIDCSHFPSDYGAVPVDWLSLGGWTGVQNPGSNSGGFANIETIVSSLCLGGNCCKEGMYCSYACPAGYQKSQWPTTQGATGQSVGGLLCQNGKLHLTNPGLSNKLCMTGASQVTVLVKNTLSKNVAVCRTDYPGTESETVPVDVQPGATSNLTCPDAANYYKWQGASTSAQYYVNPAGVSVSDACQWGSAANPWGNYAPMNLGVGWSNGAAWLSIFQNAPTTNAKLEFTVQIKGDGISGTCRYSNGQYCGGANYDQCSSTTGCTVSSNKPPHAHSHADKS